MLIQDNSWEVTGVPNKATYNIIKWSRCIMTGEVIPFRGVMDKRIEELGKVFNFNWLESEERVNWFGLCLKIPNS